MTKFYHYPFEKGHIWIQEKEEIIMSLSFEEIVKETKYEETELIRETWKQLQEYFIGNRTQFTIPIKTQGTEFQEKVWKALLEIPYGETRTYRQIAEKIGNPKACRAVGMANHNNPIGIIIPCHRVVGTNGKLVGYAGGMDVKEYLLGIERKNKENLTKMKKNEQK